LLSSELAHLIRFLFVLFLGFKEEAIF